MSVAVPAKASSILRLIRLTRWMISKPAKVAAAIAAVPPRESDKTPAKTMIARATASNPIRVPDRERFLPKDAAVSPAGARRHVV